MSVTVQDAVVTITPSGGFAATVGQQISFLDHGKLLFTGVPAVLPAARIMASSRL